MKCRHCHNELSLVFCDLQTCPPSNAMISPEAISQPEVFFPLKVFVCDKCWLVQVDEIEKAEAIFNSDYTYFSSYSTSWLEHARRYVDYMSQRFRLSEESLVVEIASNDGYLLQYFHQKKVPVIGVEPTANTAKVAQDKGINTIVDFFGSRLAKEKLQGKADLILGNNVLAHVPDINDFVSGVKIALKPNGVITFEFPHLCKLIQYNQFDTIYHEHFSYLSLTAVKTIFNKQELEIFDVQELPTHGGSLRIFVKHSQDSSKLIASSVSELLKQEHMLGVDTPEYYSGFQEKVNKISRAFWSFLLKARGEGKTVVGYGAAAKGNTLLNYCGIKSGDLISYVVDASLHKQGKLLPGSRIPVFSPEMIKVTNPDYIILFPWNLREEIINQLSYVKFFGSKFVVLIPELEIF
jgi:2-polyprenyl-3-methyl-5-hydroxy-6-metoxy-1,4-benzoquinol methylase